MQPDWVQVADLQTVLLSAGAALAVGYTALACQRLVRQSDVSSQLLRSSDREHCRRACCCVRGLCGACERGLLRPSLTTVVEAVIVRIDC